MRFTIFFSTVLAGLVSINGAVAEEAAVWIGMSAPAHGERQGIYRATLDTKTGALSTPELTGEIGAPEFLAIHPNGKILYAACQLAKGKPGVAAFEISNDRRSLQALNTAPTGDGGACHLATDRSGRWLFTAQYGTGTVAVFPLDEKGRVGSRTSLVHHTGSGPNQARQEGPHPHWVGTDPMNKFLFVPDLGSDQIVIYEFDAKTGTIKPHGHGSCPPGSGPRHFAFHPNGRFAYVVNELGISVTAFAYDAEAGTLKAIETVDSLPKPLREIPSTGAEICMHPSGKFLYASTRNHDSVSAFRIDSETGRLTLVEQEPIRGSHPRSCGLDPSGHWLIAAGRDSNTLAVFRIDSKTGGLVFADRVVNSPAPICVEIQAMR